MGFAILVPAYQCKSTIAETLESLIAQGDALKRVEAMYIADDGSTDHTLTVAEKTWQAPTPLRILKAEKNRGEYANVNEAVASSSTPELSGAFTAAVSEGAGISQYTVRLTRLNDELRARGWDRVDILKIDAEGYDFHCLRGAAELLRAGCIRVIQFEYGYAWPHANSTLAAALKFLHDLGLSDFLLRPRGLAPVNYDRFGEHFCFANYVAVTPESLPILQSHIIR